MADLFMHINNEEQPGMTTHEGLEGKGWFAIDEMSFACLRPVTMETGRLENRVGGSIEFSQINISKLVCGASNLIMSTLWSPKDKGNNIVIASTINDINDKAKRTFWMTWSMENCFISTVSQRALNRGGHATETLSISYGKIEIEKYTHDEDGKDNPKSTIIYDIAKDKLDASL